MIRPEAYRAVLTVALIFVILPSLLLFGERPGTAPFLITVAALMIGAVFVVLVLFIIRYSTERDPTESDHKELP